MMTSAYPGALDALKTNVNGATDTLASVPHDALHNDANAAIKAVQATLGTNPQGAAATVAARISALSVSGSWRVGSGAPTPQAGDDEGHMYLDLLTGNAYRFESGAWVFKMDLSGPQGDPGTAATVTPGTTTTGAPGSAAAVTNSGTSSAAVLDFVIPEGDVGPAGDSALAAPFTASISGAYTLDVTKPVQWLTITGATTITMPPVPADKTVPLTVVIQQNVVGGYAVTLPTSASTPKCWWAQGIPPTLDTAANARHWLYFVGAPGLDWTGFTSALKVG